MSLLLDGMIDGESLRAYASLLYSWWLLEIDEAVGESRKDLMCFLTEAHRPLDLHGLFTSWKLPEIEGAQKHVVLNRHSESVWLAVPM